MKTFTQVVACLCVLGASNVSMAQLQTPYVPVYPQSPSPVLFQTTRTGSCGCNSCNPLIGCSPANCSAQGCRSCGTGGGSCPSCRSSNSGSAYMPAGPNASCGAGGTCGTGCLTGACQNAPGGCANCPSVARPYGGAAVCPVDGSVLGSRGPVVPVVVQGRTINVCCDRCRAALLQGSYSGGNVIGVSRPQPSLWIPARY